MSEGLRAVVAKSADALPVSHVESRPPVRIFTEFDIDWLRAEVYGARNARWCAEYQRDRAYEHAAGLKRHVQQIALLSFLAGALVARLIGAP